MSSSGGWPYFEIKRKTHELPNKSVIMETKARDVIKIGTLLENPLSPEFISVDIL